MKRQKQIDPIVFKPEYDIRFVLSVVGTSLFSIASFILAAAALYKTITEGDVLSFLGVPFFLAIGSLCLWPLSMFVKVIYFEDEISVVRYLMPDKTIEYHEIYDVSEAAIYTKQGQIRLSHMMNSYELLAAVKKRKIQGYIGSKQITGEASKRLAVNRQAGTASLLISGVLTLAVYAAGFDDIIEDPELVFIVFWAVTFFMIRRGILKSTRP